MTEEQSEAPACLVVEFHELNGGGFNVVVGNLTHACTTLQEAFNFAATHAETYFKEGVAINMQDLPRFMKPSLWERIRHGTLGVTTTLAFVSVLGLAMWGKHEEKPVTKTTAKYIDLTEGWTGETTRFPLAQTDPGDEQASAGGPRSVPQMDLRSLWEEGDGVRAEPGQYPDEARRARVSTHNKYRRKRRRLPVADAKPNP